MALKWNYTARMAKTDAPTAVYIGLGSNLGNRRAYLRAGIRDLAAALGMCFTQASSVYLSPPAGPVAQPDFYNAAAAFTTTLPPTQLLRLLLKTEDIHGRQRKIHWGPRTLDLDLLLYGQCRIDTPNLKIPHPYLTRRDWVLMPLEEIAPDLADPQTGLELRTHLETLAITCKRLGPLD
jgi:2-amino-4-hydroxy-6-hydroxymethyldihydropteridine diphosphokinase